MSPKFYLCNIIYRYLEYIHTDDYLTFLIDISIRVHIIIFGILHIQVYTPFITKGNMTMLCKSQDKTFATRD